MKNRVSLLSICFVCFVFVAIAIAGGSIDGLYENDSGELSVRVSIDSEGCYVGCSFYLSDGSRVDMDAEFAVGNDTIHFSIPDGAYKAEVALWREKYKLGEGPDPDNGWAKENGYYLWDEIDRDVIRLSQ